MRSAWIRWPFVVAGLYDGLLGLAFAVAPAAIFARVDVVAPNHMGYVQFPALLLVLFAIMFFAIAADPVRRRELMLFGAGLKVAYCAVVFGYAVTTGISPMWRLWAWIDVVFLCLFLAAWRAASREARSAES